MFGRPGRRIFRERNQFRRPHQVKGHVVFNSAHCNARDQDLKNKDESQDARHESAGGWQSERAKNIVEQNLGAVTNLSSAGTPASRSLGLRGSHFDAHGEVRRRRVLGQWCTHFAQLAKTLQVLAAIGAEFQVLADARALLDAIRPGESVVKVTGQPGAYRITVHRAPPQWGCWPKRRRWQEQRWRRAMRLRRRL